MAKIAPFKALRYSKKVSLKDVVCPPYDVINRVQREGYIRKSPHNIVKIVLPGRSSRGVDYKKAAAELSRWIDRGVLKYDDTPSFYVYVQECLIEGKKIRRSGFLSLLKLEDSVSKGVLPHENVFSKPLLGRVSLMQSIKAHPSPIFIVFQDKNSKAQMILQGIINTKKPDINIRADNSRHKLWFLKDKALIEKLTLQLKTSQTFIADGHHRYRASIKVRDYFEKQGYIPFSANSAKLENGMCPCFSDGHKYALAYLVSSKDKGLKILPTHRAVKALPKAFSLDCLQNMLWDYFDISFIQAKKADDALRSAFTKKKCAFVLYYKKKHILVVLKDKKVVKNINTKGASIRWKGLDVSILHNLVFRRLLRVKEQTGKDRNIYYYKDKKELIAQVNAGRQALGVLLNPSTMEDVVALAKNKEKMPHKSTYFYPKPLTGLVIHKF
jgi:uncharacterized protein (DUF1015 family)